MSLDEKLAEFEAADLCQIGVGEAAGILRQSGLGLRTADPRQRLARRGLQARIAASKLLGNGRRRRRRGRADPAQGRDGGAAQVQIGTVEGCRQGVHGGRRRRPQPGQRLGRQDAVVLGLTWIANS